jgi:hypothetical protein
MTIMPFIRSWREQAAADVETLRTRFDLDRNDCHWLWAFSSNGPDWQYCTDRSGRCCLAVAGFRVLLAGTKTRSFFDFPIVTARAVSTVHIYHGHSYWGVLAGSGLKRPRSDNAVSQALASL